MPRITLFIVLLALAPAARSQQTQATGSVTGHVFCADTHLPARLASVYLLSVVNPNTTPVKVSTLEDQSHEAATNVLQTVLDGSFTIPNVHPGNYYVIAEQPGYLSPLAQLSREALNHPDKTTLALMAQLLTPVTVAANKLSSVQVSMPKGAGVSGVVRFDDGSPSVGTTISLLHQDTAGKWVSFHDSLLHSGANTDDRGAFRISGLPAGKYLVKASLSMQNITTDEMFGGGSGMSSYTGYSLSLFSGNATRPRDAKPFTLSSGEDLTLPDFEIPLAKLHTVTGTLLVGETGVAANSGKVTLLYPDDKTEFTSTTVSKDDNAFHFLYVPEGNYLLEITSAKQVSRTEVPVCDHCFPPSRTEEKTIRSFGDAQQPLVIANDITGLTVTIPPTPTPSKASNPVSPNASN